VESLKRFGRIMLKWGLGPVFGWWLGTSGIFGRIIPIVASYTMPRGGVPLTLQAVEYTDMAIVLGVSVAALLAGHYLSRRLLPEA